MLLLPWVSLLKSIKLDSLSVCFCVCAWFSFFSSDNSSIFRNHRSLTAPPVPLTFSLLNLYTLFLWPIRFSLGHDYTLAQSKTMHQWLLLLWLIPSSSKSLIQKGVLVLVLVWKGMLYSGKMFNFFNRKDVRKILKRKDSDAGERGTLFPAFTLSHVSSHIFLFFRGLGFGVFSIYALILQCSCNMVMVLPDLIE